MSETLQALWGFLQDLQPFRPVMAWEKGVLTVLNRPRKDLGPGVYLVVPFFMDVVTVSVCEAIITTPLQFTTLMSGEVASFSASATVQVEDIRKALIGVDKYEETTQELIAAVIAQELSEAKPERFETAIKRRNLLSELTATLDAETLAYGVRVRQLRFTNFATKVRTYRLVQDSATAKYSAW